MRRKAYFASGCFWCITPAFESLEGVLSVRSGYSGGEEQNPTYEDVKKQRTGHRETVAVEYDDGIVSFQELLEVFFSHVDPFDEGGQFIDRGHSYTLAVYCTTEEEKVAVEKAMKEIEAASGRKVHVSVEPFSDFFEAEEYHQDYWRKNPEAFGKELEESGRLKEGKPFVLSKIH